MKRVEFKTRVHNGVIELPKGTSVIQDKDVTIIITWEEKASEAKPKKKAVTKGKSKKKELNEFQKYLLTWPEMTDEDYNYIKEKREHFNKWK